VSVLDRKLLRDLRRLAPQVAAIALLGGIGVAVAVMANGALKAVEVAQARYYDQTRFADVFAGAERAPDSLAARLRAIDGVVAVDTRAGGAGLMSVPGLDRPAHVQLLALPRDPASALNQLVLTSGRMPAEGRGEEAVALKAFVDAAHVSLGQRLTMVVNGRQATFAVVGAVLSPEYVYSPSETALPDDAHRAVVWAPPSAVEGATGQVGAFSQAALKVSQGANTRQVLAETDRLLAPYGGSPAVARADQPSNNFLVQEEQQLRTLTWLLPPVFLLVAAGLTHMVMGRLVETEREQIGLLKAFGRTDAEAALPYLKLAGVIGLLGVAAGGLVGAALAAALVGLYADYFRFPVFQSQFDWSVFAITGLIAVAAALAGAALAAFRAAGMRPAAAMRPAPPATFHRGLFDALGLVRHLDQPSRMILRRLERYPARAALTAAGFATSLALLVGTQFMQDALERVVDDAYYRTHRWSAQVTFFHPRQIGAVLEAARLPGVIAAEPVRMTVAWAAGPAGRKRVAVVGLEPDATLAGPLDAGGRRLALIGRGVVVSKALAERLGLAPGQGLDLDVLEGRRPHLYLPITALADDYSGLSVYMARQELNRLMGDGDLASGADLIAAPDLTARFYDSLEARPQIIAASSRDDTVANWRTVSAKSFSISVLFYLGFAGAIALGVAYNMSRIILAERSRDLATLQVLGFSRGECAYILYGEIVLIAVFALPVGAGLGVAFAHALALGFSQDELRLPVTITPRTLGVSITAYVVSVAAGCLMLARQLARLDLVAVLKTRD